MRQRAVRVFLIKVIILFASISGTGLQRRLLESTRLYREWGYITVALVLIEASERFTRAQASADPCSTIPNPRPVQETPVLSSGPICALQSTIPQISVHTGHRHCTLTDSRCTSLYRSVPHISGREYPRHACLQIERLAFQWPAFWAPPVRQ